MSLSDLAALGSFVSGFAVLVSLVFLYFQLGQIGAQIKQAEKNQQASIASIRATRLIDTMNAMLEPSAADAFYMGMAGTEDMSPTQVRQFSLACFARFSNAEDSFLQHKDGLLSEGAFSSFVTKLKASFSAPGYRTAWQILRNQFGGGFVEFVDKLIAETPVTSAIDPSRLMARWMAGFASEKAKAAD